MIRLYGHRGARGEAPENTLTGFRYTLGLGITAFEFDVRLSADEQLVVIHDETVDRTTNGTGRVADLTLADLRRLEARGQRPQWPEHAGIPTLAEVLDTLAPARPVLQVEVKRDSSDRMRRVCAGIARAVQERGLEDRSVVSSFEVEALELIRGIAPHLGRAFITSTDPAAGIETADRLGCAQVCLQLAILSRERVEEGHARHLEVCGWVGNTPQELQHLVDCGVDALTTDLPTVALEFLRARTG